MNIEDNAANTAQNQGFCSIAEIEEYKSRVKEDIQDDEAKIASLWNSLFHKEEPTMQPRKSRNRNTRRSDSWMETVQKVSRI